MISSSLFLIEVVLERLLFPNDRWIQDGLFMVVSIFKVLLVGDPNVGKSSLIRRMLLDEFDQDYQTTVGVDLSAVTLNIDSSNPIILTVIDLGGQEDFTDLRTHYYRDAHFAALVFDISDRTSFEALPDWLRGMNLALGLPDTNPVSGLIIGNKSDKSDTRKTSVSEAGEYAASHSCEYIETSAKTGMNVVEVFTKIGNILVESQDET